MKTLDLGNNETLSRGIAQHFDGTYTAMSYTQSRDFKTLKGAQKWLARQKPTMSDESKRQAVRTALSAVVGQLTSEQLNALADASREIEVANRHYGLNSQVTAIHEAGQLMDSIVDGLRPFYVSETYDKLSKIKGETR